MAPTGDVKRIRKPRRSKERRGFLIRLNCGAMKSFSAAVREKLGHYLYIDPRTDEIFYVGKGDDNRAFYHLKREDEGDVAVPPKVWMAPPKPANKIT